MTEDEESAPMTFTEEEIQYLVGQVEQNYTSNIKEWLIEAVSIWYKSQNHETMVQDFQVSKMFENEKDRDDFVDAEESLKKVFEDYRTIMGSQKIFHEGSSLSPSVTNKEYD